MSVIYSIANETDLLLCGGDFNARLGDNFDFIEGVDNLSMRRHLEKDTNKHCEPFIDFLLGAKMCILNGRSEGKNDFTYVTAHGKSVVDYCLTFIDHLNYIKSCDVLHVKEIFESVTNMCNS